MGICGPHPHAGCCGGRALRGTGLDQSGQPVVGRIGTRKTQTRCHRPPTEVGRVGHDSRCFRALHQLGTLAFRAGLCGRKAVLGRHDHHPQHALALHVSRERAGTLRRMDVHHHRPHVGHGGCHFGHVVGTRPPNVSNHFAGWRGRLVAGIHFVSKDSCPGRTKADRARTRRTSPQATSMA